MTNSYNPLMPLQFNLNVFNRLIQDIDQETSLYKMHPNANHINWLLGHLIFTRTYLFKQMKIKWELPPSFKETYSPSNAKNAAHAFMEIEELKALYLQSNEMLVTYFQNSSKQVIAFSETMTGFMMHETYHFGQVGIIRRSLGLTAI